MTLTEFLLERLAEDESDNRPQVARPGSYFENSWHRQDCDRNTYNAGDCDCGLPARVLAECEAKREALTVGQLYGCATTLAQILAQPYADHPDYDEAWRP